MKISIIVPFYNREKTAERCLNSLLASTYKNIEIIAVDDGSTDKTLEILQDFSNRDSRLKIVTQENSGPSAARNNGLDNATGDFVAFCDSDDWVDLSIYQKMFDLQQQTKADVVITGFYSSYQDGTSIECPLAVSGVFNSGKEIQDNIIWQFYNGNPTGLAALWNKLYKKEFIDNNNLRFDEALHRAEDWWLNMHAYEFANCIAVLNEPLYYYWQDGTDNLMKKLKAEYYWQWKASNAYLINKNDTIYHFDVNLNHFYKEQLFTIHALLLNMSVNKENIDCIINDDYYNRIIQYDKFTSLPVKICHIAHKVSKNLEKILYKTLAVYYN